MRTDITVILDRSGSMQSTRDDAMNGFNALVEDQKTAPGEAWLSLVQFDDQYEVDYLETPMREVPALTRDTYTPRGSTALLDAIGRTIDAVGSQKQRPFRKSMACQVHQGDGPGEAGQIEHRVVPKHHRCPEEADGNGRVLGRGKAQQLPPGLLLERIESSQDRTQHPDDHDKDSGNRYR